MFSAAPLPGMQHKYRETEKLVAYVRGHPEVTSVLITGGDLLTMKSRGLRR